MAIEWYVSRAEAIFTICFWCGVVAQAAVADGEGPVQPIADVSSQNAGLFVGVNSYPLEGAERVKHLTYAVDDAIALAHLFALELELITPAQTWLALSDEPKQHELLEKLRAGGATITKATGSHILQALDAAAPVEGNTDRGLRDESALVVVFVSAHGVLDGSQAYVVPSDGLLRFVPQTCISTGLLAEILYRSGAGKRLLILDACRDRRLAGAKGGAGSAPGEFFRALASARGEAVLRSCAVGQTAWEDRDLQHGVFTHFLIQALRGKASADQDGYIRLHNVAEYVAREVPTFVRRTRNESQTPNLDAGPDYGGRIPLAIHTGVHDTFERRNRSLITFLAGRKITADDFEEGRDLFKAPVGELSGIQQHKLAIYIDLVEGKIGPDRLQLLLNVKPIEMLRASVARGGAWEQFLLGWALLERRPDFNFIDALPRSWQVPPEIAGQVATAVEAIADPTWKRSSSEALQLIHTSAEDSELPPAMTLLAVMHRHGKGGLEKDEAKAVLWYQKAADAGDSRGMAYLGKMHEDGKGGLAKDEAEAVRWYQKAADAGDRRGMSFLGSMHYYGKGGLAKDEAEALRWHLKAANAGDSRGMVNLGLMHRRGEGGLAKDEAEAVRLYQKAADSGNGRGMAYLGLMHEYGNGGLAKDEAEAVRWYRKSAALGDDFAIKQLSRLGKAAPVGGSD